MSRKWFTVFSLTMTVFMLSGCGLFGPEETSTPPSIDPPRMSQTTPAGPSQEVNSNVQSKQPDSAENPADAGAEQSMATPVYLLDADGFVVPVTLNLPKSDGPAKQVLTYMVKGGPVEEILPQGFSAPLPEGTKVLGLTIKDGVAVVDFSPEFEKYEAKDEQKIVDAITFALTSFPTVKEVKIWINGYPQEVMPVNGTPISSLTRENGINKELAANVQIGNTTPVTLYFQAQTQDSVNYFVPVTRLIPRTEDRAKATVEQLIRGPKQGTNLYSALLPTTKVLGVEVGNGIVTVDFDDKLLSYDNGKANPLALESILLSLTENTGASQVQFMVNGQKNVMAGDRDYSKPVSRPEPLNPSRM